MERSENHPTPAWTMPTKSPTRAVRMTWEFETKKAATDWFDRLRYLIPVASTTWEGLPEWQTLHAVHCRHAQGVHEVVLVMWPSPQMELSL